MSKAVRFTVELSIHEGKLAEFEKLAETMIAGTRKEPGAVAYDWFFSSDRKRCHLLETYADANAVVAHLESAVVRELVPKLLTLAKLERFAVYGDPGAKASEILAGVRAEIFSLWRGLGR